MITLYDAKCTDFNNNGLLVLSDVLSCPVTEELNGTYECTLEYPIDERGKWQYLLEGNIIKTDGQLFRISRKVKTLTSIKTNARHIFYDLLDNLLEDVRPTDLSGSAALDWILNRTQYPHSFASISDVGGSGTRYFIRQNPVEAIMGTDGIIETWGGELVRDNYTIKLLQARGLDRGVLIAYGKNIQGIEETLDTDGVCTRMMPLGKDALMLPEKYIDSPYINNYPHPKIKTLDFPDIGIDGEQGITEEMAIEQLRAAATIYMQNGKIDVPTFNYKINFLELSKTEEYKNYKVLESVYLGDTVTIKHAKLNINLKSKVIKTTKNVLTGRLEIVELGSFKPNIASSINNSIQAVKTEIVSTKSSLQTAIDNATTQINSALGGYVVKRNGELLIMDTEDVNTATKVWRWNEGGLGYSGTGYNGEFRTAITADGHIVADFMDTGNMTANIIKTGTITSKTGKLTINMDDEVLNIGGKIIYDSATDHVTFDPSVVLSWGNIGDKPNIPSTAADVGALPADTPIPNGANLDDSGNYTGSIDYTTQVDGKPEILTADDVRMTVVTKEWIATLGLLVGTEIQMGTNATISWSSVEGAPAIPTTAADIGAETPTGAQAKADAAQAAATSVANSAQSTANSAASAASTAQSTANTANYNASTAQSTANNAQSTANAAYGLADAAVTPVELTTKLGQDYVVTGKLTANQIQTGTYNANGAPINANGTVIDSNGVAVTGGKISVTNPSGTVIIDGTSNMFKILTSGTTTLSLNYTQGYKEVTINHNLGYCPVVFAFVLQDNQSFPMPCNIPYATSYGGDPNTSGRYSIFTVKVTTTQIILRMQDNQLSNYSWTQPLTGTIKYYILKEAAF